MERMQVVSRLFRYDIVVGCDAWRELRTLLAEPYSSVFVLTELGLWRRWGRSFARESGLRQARCLFVPAGERSKNLRMVERVGCQLLARGADRRSLLVAFGGGVVGDLAGFVASTYMRGIDYVQVPTTVVAQVDSSIGGKTAVNAGATKNLLGTFYPPRLVLCNPVVLSSLNERAFRSGLYEVVKHAILAGAPLFAGLESRLGQLYDRELATLELFVARAARVKVGIVSRDEREAGLRRVLNLGHTYGHALEEATDYRRFLHGEAVGWGLLAATRLAERLGLLATTPAERIRRLLHRVGPLPTIRDLPWGKIAPLLPRDKKAVGGRIHWVVPTRIGEVTVTADVPLRVAAAAYEDFRGTDRNG